MVPLCQIHLLDGSIAFYLFEIGISFRFSLTHLLCSIKKTVECVHIQIHLFSDWSIHLDGKNLSGHLSEAFDSFLTHVSLAY